MRAFSAVVLFWAAFAGCADAAAPDQVPSFQAGEAPFQAHCASCHEHAGSGAPDKILLGDMSPPAIYEALTRGVMRAQAAGLSDTERRQVAEYLTQKSLTETRSRPLLKCTHDAAWFDRQKGGVGTGWGIDPDNARLIPAAKAGLLAADVPRLKLRWVFAYPGAERATAQPMVARGAVFVGSQDGSVYALDARSGCLHWTFKAAAEIRGATVLRLGSAEQGSRHARALLYVGDLFAYVYALDARTGRLVWKTKVDDHPAARVAGTPVLHEDRLYVPVTAVDEIFAGPDYVCCTGRGSVVALNAETGEQIWKRYTIPAPAVEQGKDAQGKAQFGPSGAGIWSTLLIDPERETLYFTTGNNYSAPGDENSDAIFALHLESGEVKWRTQTVPGDIWNGWAAFCQSTQDPPATCKNQPTIGPDIDFTAPPLLVRLNDRNHVLITGRKDGATYGVDPDTGHILWTERVSQSPDPYRVSLYFGMMADDQTVIVPTIGENGPHFAAVAPTDDDGLYALDASTGKRLWVARVKDDCPKAVPCLGIAEAPIGFAGVAFAGSMDGYVRAYDTHSGAVLWRFDTAREFLAVNRESAKGGAVGGSGIMVAHGMLYVNSGYRGSPGNVLLAFAVDSKHR